MTFCTQLYGVLNETVAKQIMTYILSIYNNTSNTICCVNAATKIKETENETKRGLFRSK